MARAMVSASSGAMNSVIAKLTTLEGDEYKIRKSTKREMVLLRQELTTMKGLMDRPAEAEDLDPLVKEWKKQVREMTYDLEDTIDRFMHSLRYDAADKPRGLRPFISKSTHLLKKSGHGLFTQIRELKKQIVEASERRNRYKIDVVVSSASHLRLSSMSNREEPRLPVVDGNAEGGLVGMDGPKEEIIHMLTADGEQQLRAVAIAGFGGSGKTTLAMEVYRSLGRRFDFKSFVTVSQRPDMRKILMSIFSQVSASDHSSKFNFQVLDIDELIREIRKFLHDKRYFIVIDDLWSPEEWRIIRCALLDNTRGSKVLITTRNMHVARVSCPYVYEMKLLSVSDAGVLFFNTIFHSKDNCPPHLVNVSNDIIRGCAGVPLVIIIIAALLCTKSEIAEEWVSVRDQLKKRVSLVYLDWIRTILSLSYANLPFHLKTCLLYLCVFPEDHHIDRKRLVRKWIAENFIIGEHGQSLEEVAEFYFNELINRRLVQPVGIQCDGQVLACRVHDLMLDFLLHKSTEENFVTIYYDCDEVRILRLQDKIRRLSLRISDLEDTFTESVSTAHVRSLTIFGCTHMPDLANFQALRVLDIEICGVLENHHLQYIGRLYMLTYLRIKTASAVELPEEIGELRYLQTLDLAGASIRKLPRSVVQLKQLSYLLVDNVILPVGIGKLLALQEISCIKFDSSYSASSLKELGSLIALRILGLNWCIRDIDTDKKSCEDSLVYSLTKVSSSKLQFLYIESGDGCSLDFLLDMSISSYCLQELRIKSRYHFPMIPIWMSSLINLTLLEININPVDDKVFQILREMPALLVMLLSSKSSLPEQRLLIGSNGFRVLRQFGLTCRNTRPMLMFEQGAMPKLEKLQLSFSAQGECVPSLLHYGLEHLIFLKHLIVEINCRGAKFSEVKAAEDAIENAIRTHPNHPKYEIERKDEEHMVKNERENSVHGDEGQEGQDEEGDDVKREIEVEESTSTADS